MDYVSEVRLQNEFRNLDAALKRNDRIAAMMHTDQINSILGNTPRSTDTSLTAGLPNWVQRLIQDRGVRLTGVENALKANKVVLSPTFGKSGYGVKLEISF
jgi:hypothetical protein